MVELVSYYATIIKVSNKTFDLVSAAKVSNRKTLGIRVKALPYDNGKEYTAQE
jgi:hypothetical protein